MACAESGSAPLAEKAAAMERSGMTAGTAGVAYSTTLGTGAGSRSGPRSANHNVVAHVVAEAAKQTAACLSNHCS